MLARASIGGLIKYSVILGACPLVLLGRPLPVRCLSRFPLYHGRNGGKSATIRMGSACGGVYRQAAIGHG
jgi:hypothetical protein